MVTAANPTLHEILSKEKGPACIKSLAWMMFGGLEDGATIIIEPLLDEDVTIDLNNNSALIAMRFGVKAPAKRHQWTGKDKREFDNLEQALAEAENAMEAHGAEALHEAISEKDTEAKSKPKRKLKLKRKRPNRLKQKRNKKKDDPFTTFVKAAKFVRGIGAGTIHPSAKLRLFGLLMQAQRGSIPEGDQGKDFDLPGLKGSALALQKLKLRAWQSQKDKKREDAMKEYVEVVTSLAPQWKVAHLLGGHASLKDKKGRQMMWVLKVNYREATVEERTKPLTVATSTALSGLYRVTRIEVLQSSNATSSRLWVEENSAANNEKGTAADSASGGKGGEGAEEHDVDPFIANMPKEWSLSDCIVDKSKFKTMEEQRAHFQERMREMARADRDEEDGWKFYGKTHATGVPDSEQYVIQKSQRASFYTSPLTINLYLSLHRLLLALLLENRLDIHKRDVPWSSAQQWRSVMETNQRVDDVFEYLLDNFERNSASKHASKQTGSKKHEAAVAHLVVPFTCLERNAATCLVYREAPFPWYVLLQ
tara:strand:- start:946 stop:2556 length:1611 start_codon:yes stop_codon:yes gene_type:complete